MVARARRQVISQKGGGSRMPPVIIGVAGGTGSGKTTVVREIVHAVGEEQVAVIAHDSYYRDRSELPLEERALLNYDHPDALETDLLVQHLEELRAGHTVEVPSYDFSEHARTDFTRTVHPSEVILIDGILIFVDERLRELMDVKVFVDTDSDLRFIRRLERDLKERGRTMDSVVEQYLETVKPMHEEFVEPSKRFADLLITEGGYNRVALDILLAKIRAVIASSQSHSSTSGTDQD
jgi:uridine kinase